VAVVHGAAAAAIGAVDDEIPHTTVPTVTRTAVRIRRRYQIECPARREREMRYCPCCVIVIAVPVIVRVAVRVAPEFGAPSTCTFPLPAPYAPCMIVRKLALLVAVHLHEFGVVTEIDADPPDAAKVVVVTPVMIWQPDGPVVGFEVLLLQAAARSK